MPLRDRFRSFNALANPHNPHEWKLPHRFPTATDIDSQPQIPDITIFRDLSSEKSSQQAISEIAVHLCLLECFHKFKQDVIHSEALGVAFQGLVNTEEEQVIGGNEKDEEKQGDFDQKGHKSRDYEQGKWNLVVRIAVARFEAWWQKIEGILFHAAAYASCPQNGRHVSFTKDYLPPLDVLMVWYSYILDTPKPDIDGDQHSKHKPFTTLVLPWRAIYRTIDRETFAYNLSKPAQNIFRTQLSQSPDLLTYIATPPPYPDPSNGRPRTDLISAVHVQERLIETSHRLLWIRSPSLSGSLNRSLQRYRRSLPHLLQTQPPDLSNLPYDLALAWSTHRLNPPSYRQQLADLQSKDTFYELDAAFNASLQPAIQSPSQSAAHESHDRPQPCLCWTCESLKTLTDTPSPPFPSLTKTQRRALQSDLGFYIAAESARRAGRRLPAHHKAEKRKKKEDDKWVEDFGLRFYEEVIPAKYDRDGRLVRKEERKVRREKAYAQGFMWTALMV